MVVLTLLALTIIVFKDIGESVAGKLFGQYKLAPTISPVKTWVDFGWNGFTAYIDYGFDVLYA